MPNDPINQSADLLLEEKKIEVASKQNTEIEEVIDTIDNDLGFFANKILRLTVGKTKLREILSKQKINSKDDFLDAAFNKDATLFGSEQLGSAANWIGKKTLEFSNYFSDVFNILAAKNKEILAIVDKYKLELDNLKDEIEDNENKDKSKDIEGGGDDEGNGDNANNTKPSTFGVGSMAYGTVIGTSSIAGYGINKIDKFKINKQLEAMNMDVEKQKKAISDIIGELEIRKKRKGFNTPEGAQSRKNIQKTIDHFEQMKKDLRVSRRALSDRKKLEKVGLLDKEAFAFFSGQQGSLDNLKKITKSGQLDELKKLLKSNPQKAKQLLGIAENVDMPKGLIKSIKNIHKIEDITKIGTVLKNAKVLSRAAKFMHSVPLLDLAFLGLDIWMWDSARNESDKVRQYNQMRAQVLDRQANAHLAVGIASASAEVILAIAALSSAGPAGWAVMGIGAAIGGTVAAVDRGFDVMYYDILNFYNKNTKDYINQYRTENKQAIVSIMQSLNPHVENSSNESLFIDEENVDNKQKMTTMIDAYQALVLNEELLSLDDKDNAIVKTRMQYIKANLGTKEIMAACVNGDINAPARLLAESKIYEQMLQDQEYITKNSKQKSNLQSLINYKAWLSLQLENEKPESYHYLMQMSDDEFFWIHHIMENKDSSEQDLNSTVYQNTKLIQEVFLIRSFRKTQEELYQYHQSISPAAYFSLDNFLGQEVINEGLKTPVSYSKEELTQNYIEGNTDYYEKTILSDVSDNPSQNILYRVAKEIHGYDGANRTEDVLMFFSGSDKEDSLGIYYDGDRMINNDRALDKSFDPAILIDTSLSNEDIIKKLVKPNWVNHILNFIVPGGIVLGATGHGFAGKIDAIDTATETADESLNLNFWAQFAHILEQERAYLMPANKAKIQTDIKKYIKENASNGYISLPYYLQIQALKAGLGNCENSFFSYEDGKIIEMVAQRPYSATLNFLHIKKPFVDKTESIARPYDTLEDSEKKIFDQETKKFISPVDKAIEKLNTILQDGELDIPEAYQKIIDNKISERQLLKFSLKGYTNREAKSKLVNNYESYTQRFDNLYLSLLSGVYSNMFVADQDSALVMNQHLEIARHNIISIDSKNGDVTLLFQGHSYEKTENKDKYIEAASSNALTKMFFMIYSKVKIPHKGKKLSCENLAKNGETEAATHYAKLIRRSLLELETVDFDIDKKGNLSFDSFNSNLEKGIEKHWDKALIVSPFAFPATLFSVYKSSKEKEQKQALFMRILAYNFKNNPYSLPKFDEGF